MRMKELRKQQARQRPSDGFAYFHIGRKPNLTELRPSRFDVHGRMPEPAVFVTDADHIAGWASYIRDGRDMELYLYGVAVPEGARIEEGIDGAEEGDLKVITSNPLPATFLHTI